MMTEAYTKYHYALICLINSLDTSPVTREKLFKKLGKTKPNKLHKIFKKIYQIGNSK